MKWNRNIAVVPVILAVALIVGFVSYAQSKPDYVQDAATRLSSYLTSYYGPAECSGNLTKEKLWQVKCIVASKGKSFEFTVMPAEMAPYAIARSFYLKANDAESEKAAQLGLMKYLQIDTKHSDS